MYFILAQAEAELRRKKQWPFSIDLSLLNVVVVPLIDQNDRHCLNLVQGRII